MARAVYGVGLNGGGYQHTLTPMQNEAFSVIWPRTRPSQGAKGVIFAIHGAGGGARQGGSGGYWETLITYLADVHNYLVVAIDAGSNGSQGTLVTNCDTWGNNVAMAAMDAAFKWGTQGISSNSTATYTANTLQDTTQNWQPQIWAGHKVTAGGKTGYVATNNANTLTLGANWTGGTPGAGSSYSIDQHYTDIPPFGKTTKVVLMGVSMGGWVAKNWASRNTSKVACIVDIAGVVDDTIIYTGYGAGIDLGYGPAAPPSAPSTPTGTAGATSYIYRTVEVAGNSTVGYTDGPPSASSGSANLVVLASLAATPNTVAGITHNAYNTQSQPMAGTKILRNRGGAGFGSIDTVGQTTLTTATGTGATTSLTVAALPFGIPNGCVLQLSHPAATESLPNLPLVDAGVATTQNVTVNGAVSAGATSITVNSFTPASGGLTVAWQVGTKIKVVTYIDRITATETAYTQLAAGGTSRTTGPYGVNGRNANPSYDPTNATNLTTNLKTIKLQYWWSENDGATSTGSGSPGTVNTEVQTYATAYGGNITLQNVTGGPVHANVMSTINASATMQSAIATFINTNAP